MNKENKAGISTSPFGMITVRQLQFICKTATLLSFAATAQEFGVNYATVWKAVHNAEETLGEELFLNEKYDGKLKSTRYCDKLAEAASPIVLFLGGKKSSKK